MRELKDLLTNRDYEPLVHSEDLKKVCKELITFLYGEDLFIYRASEALGLVCKKQEQEQDGEEGGEHVKNILRRLFWHLNDESGAYCRGASVAIGEIGRNTEQFEGFKNMTVSLLDNEEVELEFVIYAVGRAAKSVKNAYPDPFEKLLPLLDHQEPEIRGYAAWALGELGAEGAIEGLNELLEDENIIRIYQGEFKDMAVKDIAQESLHKIVRGEA
ncbi:MAG: HEAT repeat domain-containing protein [Archaeoglobaceae archaeon]